MKREAYAAARTVSPRIHAYFARKREEVQKQGADDLASVPAAETVEAVIDAAFWASLRREENYMPRISLAFLSPDQTTHPLIFERLLPLTPAALTRVAPAVERPGVHLGVWHEGGELKVWGTTRSIPRLCFVLEVAAPGLLVIKHHSGDEVVKFVNVAVLEGDLTKLVDQRREPDCPALVTSLLGFESSASWASSVNVLVQLAVSMRAHGHGGALLVVPAGSETWRESIVDPMGYAISPPFTELARLSREIPDESERRVWQDAVSRAVEWVAGLTAVDGAVIITDRYEVLGFGAKITRRRDSTQVTSVTVSEPITGATSTVMHPDQLGGTRHFSAAQFVHDQHDAAALVASQDGRFTVFEWSPCDDLVHGRRVEALLL